MKQKKWINPATELSHITVMLTQYDSKLMNACPINPRIKNTLVYDNQIIQPIAKKLLIEEKPPVRLPYNSGYYHSNKTLHDHEPFIPYS